MSNKILTTNVISEAVVHCPHCKKEMEVSGFMNQIESLVIALDSDISKPLHIHRCVNEKCEIDLVFRQNNVLFYEVN